MSIGSSNHRQLTSEAFGDLPDALINELLSRAQCIRNKANKHVDTQVRERKPLREQARKLGLINELPKMPNLPPQSVSAVDGSMVSKRLASFDFHAATALAVDGIGSDTSEDRSLHDIVVHINPPQPYGREVTLALMFCMEYEIANKAIDNRELVMLDGAFSTGLIAISKALVSAQNHNDALISDFFDRWTQKTMSNLPEIIVSDRVIALPKRSSANEFATQTRLFNSREIDTNGRSTASLILDANEYSGPFCFDSRTPQTWPPGLYPEFWRDVSSRLEELQVVYFKPHDWSHAYRVEMTPKIASDENRRHKALDIIRGQTTNSAMMEPYPLYVADRFAKSLNKGTEAILQAVRSEIIHDSTDPELTFAMLNVYRTEPEVEEANE